MKSYKYYDLIMALFVAVVLISNIASSAKIVDWGVSILGLRLSFDAGTLLFPISYIFGDILTEVYGYRRSRRVIWTGFAALGLMGVTLWLVRLLPGEAYWQSNVGDAAYDAVLSGVSSGAIILASLSAYLVGEFSNSVVLAKLKIATQGRWLWLRTIGSTLIGEGVDSLIFVAIATALGAPGFVWEIALSLIVSNYIFKVSIEAIMTPVTYRIIAFLKRTEHEDYYDRETDFNPFRLKSRPAA
ncbi:MAG TPA: queuosine precursor transporter [Anaerolineae bacterium]|nr:queuosine precursor transporter [Anaerolineae bacterium]